MAKNLNNVNLQKMLEEKLPYLNGGILLHCCCAACSTHCIEYLCDRTKDITLYYCNPNIDTREEYRLRSLELARFNAEAGYNLPLITEDYEPQKFYDAVRGLENTGEGGQRCEKCFALRLGMSVKKAEQLGLRYVLTTLSISPLKNAALLYEIGSAEAKKVGKAEFLPSDFKKNDGYKRSTELCRTFGIYRQNYCGCVFSKAERKGIS